MELLIPKASAESHESPCVSPPPPLYHQRSKSASEKQRDEARLTFDKTIEGHYRHGKTGYKHVGALFLTWKDDDLQCRATEVDKLRELFEREFHFKTESYEIPSERWETALHKKLADFCYEYDNPEYLAIIYYGGHAYTGRETKEFKLAAKFSNMDGTVDPTAFFSDIRTCLRLPNCDQLMILDCCFAAKAFAREPIGKQKYELIASTAHDLFSPAPHLPHSFTTTLYHCLELLVKENPKGFSTSQLYRELYHTMPIMEPPNSSNPKPLLFDQARHDYGRIWLRPQVIIDEPPKAKEDGRYLKLTFRLNGMPNLAVMNELALRLQFLPHVDQIRFEDLYAPREQITDFMRMIFQAKRIRPLIRRMLAKRQQREIGKIRAEEKGDETAKRLLKLSLDQKYNPAFDWNGAYENSDHKTKDSGHSRYQRKKSGTWPPTEARVSTPPSLSTIQLPADYKMDAPVVPGISASTLVSRVMYPKHGLSQDQAHEMMPDPDRGAVITKTNENAFEVDY